MGRFLRYNLKILITRGYKDFFQKQRSKLKFGGIEEQTYFCKIKNNSNINVDGAKID